MGQSLSLNSKKEAKANQFKQKQKQILARKTAGTSPESYQESKILEGTDTERDLYILKTIIVWLLYGRLGSQNSGSMEVPLISWSYNCQTEMFGDFTSLDRRTVASIFFSLAIEV